MGGVPGVFNKVGWFNMLKKNLLYICEFCGKESTSKELSCKCFPRQFADWGAPI